MIAVVDYGMGNLRSMAKALEHAGGEEVAVVSKAADLHAADRIVLPGVGSFGEAISNLRKSGFADVLEEMVLERRKPFLGVCLGMQMLANRSPEHGEHAGLGWIEAAVEPLPQIDSALKIPHTGWNEIELMSDAPPMGRIRSGEVFYFNHSYHLVPEREGMIVARVRHGIDFVAAIVLDNIVATQFHPEKSQRAGLDLLAEFLAWEPDVAEVISG